jgi:hypothetical protein
MVGIPKVPTGAGCMAGLKIATSTRASAQSFLLRGFSGPVCSKAVVSS